MNIVPNKAFICTLATVNNDDALILIEQFVLADFVGDD